MIATLQIHKKSQTIYTPDGKEREFTDVGKLHEYLKDNNLQITAIMYDADSLEYDDITLES